VARRAKTSVRRWMQGVFLHCGMNLAIEKDPPQSHREKYTTEDTEIKVLRASRAKTVNSR
jgi:hypothetical protein